MVPLHEFLDMSDEDREGLFPYIWTVDRKNQLSRLLVAEPMVESCEERRDFWIMLRAIAGADKKRILTLYLIKHPHLVDFVRAPTCALIRVAVDSYYMVKHFQHVTELHLKP